MLEEFVSLVHSGDFHSTNALLHGYMATFILKLLCQHALSAILVRVKHWYTFKKISLPFSGLYSHTFRKLSEPLNLSFSNQLFLYTHTHTESSATLLQTTGGQKSTTTAGPRESGGVHKNTQHHYLRCKQWTSPSSKKCRVRCIFTHRKAATSASRIPQGSPRERKLFQEPIPLPFLKAFKNPQFFTGIPHRQRKMLQRELPPPALQPPFRKASEWSSNWHLTSKGNLISPVKQAGTIFGSNGRGKKEATCEELEIIIYRAENILLHTYTHLSLSAVLVPRKNCTITLLQLI